MAKQIDVLTAEEHIRQGSTFACLPYQCMCKSDKESGFTAVVFLKQGSEKLGLYSLENWFRLLENIKTTTDKSDVRKNCEDGIIYGRRILGAK